MRRALSTDVSLLDLDPDLGSGISEDAWDSARTACRASALRLSGGVLDAASAAFSGGTTTAFLVVEGLLWREIALLDRRSVELLGPGDVVQIPTSDGETWLGERMTRLIASDETEVAVLGPAFLRAAARWPSLLAALADRLEAQRERLAIQALIGHFPNAEHRLLLVLRHLADRWGLVTPDGLLLPLPLTHDLLGQLTAARRPTVTIAARRLEAQNLVRRLEDRSWLLTHAAEDAIAAIAQRRDGDSPDGSSFMLQLRLQRTLEQAQALRAEARQILRGHP